MREREARTHQTLSEFAASTGDPTTAAELRRIADADEAELRKLEAEDQGFPSRGANREVRAPKLSPLMAGRVGALSLAESDEMQTLSRGQRYVASGSRF